MDDFRIICETEKAQLVVFVVAIRDRSEIYRQACARICKFLEARVAALENPRQIGKTLETSRYDGVWRYRAGPFRILTRIDDAKITILVLEVDDRKDIYRR